MHRPTSDRRPTDQSTNNRPLNFDNFEWPYAYLRKGSSDSLHVWSLPSWKIQIAISPRQISDLLRVWFQDGVFEVGGSNGAIFGLAKSKMAAQLTFWNIGVGARSTLGGHQIFARKICNKNQQNARILHDSCQKNYQNTRIFVIFARKIYKIPELYMIFARKMPEFYAIIARKIFLPEF